jgi:hypothetical protein
MDMRSSKSRLGKVKNIPKGKSTKMELIKPTRKTIKKKRKRSTKTKRNSPKSKSKGRKTVQKNNSHGNVNNYLTKFQTLKRTNPIQSMNTTMMKIDWHLFYANELLIYNLN